MKVETTAVQAGPDEFILVDNAGLWRLNDVAARIAGSEGRSRTSVLVALKKAGSSEDWVARRGRYGGTWADAETIIRVLEKAGYPEKAKWFMAATRLYAAQKEAA